MIDLSNNNGTHHDFKSAYVKGGQRRLYLKAIEGTNFHDRTYPVMKEAAEHVGFHVGAYNFLHPLDTTPAEIASAFERYIGAQRAGHELRPCLDCEYGSPSPGIGRWISEISALLTKHYGFKPLIYGSGWWLERCEFRSAPGALWLAAYGRNDGREYPVGKLPSPWKSLAAHQFTSNAHVIGISGHCDLNHVFVGSAIEIPKKKK